MKLKSVGSIAELSQLNKNKRDEINYENKASRRIETEFYSKFNGLQTEMKHFTLQIDNELRRNQDLRALVEDAEQHPVKGRTTVKFKALDPDSGEPGQELTHQQLVKKKKKLELSYDQIIQKTNESLAAISQLKEQVNTARSQRVIYSGIFKNLEREIRQNEEEFKKLLIENERASQELLQTEEYYKKQERLRLTHFVVPEHSELREEEPSLVLNETDKTELKKQSSSQVLEKQEEKKQHHKSMTYARSAEDQAERLQGLFRKLRLEIGVDDLAEVIDMGEHIQDENQRLFDAANEINDRIDELREEICRLEGEILAKRKHSQGGLVKVENNLREEKLKERERRLAQQTAEVEEELKRTIQFSLQLGRELGVSLPGIEQGQIGKDNIEFYVRDLESRLSNFLGNIEQSQGLERPLVKQSDRSKGEREREREATQRKNDMQIGQLLDRMEKVKEADKILSKEELMQMSDVELQRQLRKKRGRNPEDQLQLSDIEQRQVRKKRLRNPA